MHTYVYNIFIYVRIYIYIYNIGSTEVHLTEERYEHVLHDMLFLRHKMSF